MLQKPGKMTNNKMLSKKGQLFFFLILVLRNLECSSEAAHHKEYCIDIVVAIDTGCSVDLNNPNPKEIISQLISNLKLSPNHTRLGILLYNKVVENKMLLDDNTNRAEYLEALNSLKLGHVGCASRAHRAMQRSWSSLFRITNGARGLEIPKMFILMTDGVMHRNKVWRATKEAALLKAKGIHVVVIGLKSTKYENFNATDTFLSIATNSSYVTLGYKSSTDNPNNFPFFTPYLDDIIFSNITKCPNDPGKRENGGERESNTGAVDDTGDRDALELPTDDAKPTVPPHGVTSTTHRPTLPPRTRPPPTLGPGLVPRFPWGRK